MLVLWLYKFMPTILKGLKRYIVTLCSGEFVITAFEMTVYKRIACSLQHKTYPRKNTSLVLSYYVNENKETPQVRSCSKSAVRVIEIIKTSYRITVCCNYFNSLILMHITYYVPSTDWDLCLSTLRISKKL